MKTIFLIIIGIILASIIVVSAISTVEYQSAYNQNCNSDGGYVVGFLKCTYINEDFSEPRITGKMAREICSITGGECPLNYIANILEDGSKMVAVTNWDADTKTEKSFVFIIKNNTLSYDVNVIDKDVHSHPFGTTTEKKQYDVAPIYIENPNNPGELVLDLDSMQQVLAILDWCHQESLELGVHDMSSVF